MLCLPIFTIQIKTSSQNKEKLRKYIPYLKIYSSSKPLSYITCRQRAEYINNVRKAVANLNLRSQPFEARVSARKISNFLLNIATFSYDQPRCSVAIQSNHNANFNTVRNAVALVLLRNSNYPRTIRQRFDILSGVCFMFFLLFIH